MRIYLSIFLSIVAINLNGQTPVPAASQQRPVVIMHATAHLGEGSVIENSIIAFENGKITLVEKAENIKLDLEQFEVIEASGKHIYPGLISAGSQVGLQEVSALRQTRDYDEAGQITPNVRTLIAFNAESEIIPTLRFNGILLAQATPKGNLMAGTSSVMMMDGWNWEDAVYKADDGIHIYWPTKMLSPRWWMGETEAKENPNYKSGIEALTKYMNDVASYSAAEPNLKLAAGKGLLTGTKTLFVHVNAAKEIVTSVNMFKQLGVQKIVLVGASDAWYVKDFLKEHDIPILLGKTHRLPSRTGEDVDMPYKLPKLLHEAGLLVGLTYYHELNSSRNLPFVAGTAVAYGLKKEEALSMITLNVAQILGIDQFTGSIEVGKDANLVVSEGDLLDMMTNNVVKAYIQGRSIELEGKQQQMYHRYREKYGLD